MRGQVKLMKAAGSRFGTATTMAGFPAARWTGLRCGSCCPTSRGKTERSIRMTLSLAFLAPDIVKAAIDGRLPRGFGLKRMVDLPMSWSDQWRVLGLRAPAGP